MKLSTLIYLIIQGIVVALVLDHVFGLTVNDGLWWIGCLGLNGLGVYLHHKITGD